MRLKKLIKHFDFTNNIRERMEFGANVRLDAKEQYIKITETNGIYSTDSDLYAKTWAANPNSVKQWLGFECVVVNGYDDYDSTLVVTGVNFRLHDGTDEYWYNGSNWIIDNVNWNTEDEVSNNISSFPVLSKKIGVVINPYTVDYTKTPIIKAIKILYSSAVIHQYDYLYSTVVRQLKEQIRPITDYIVKLTSSSSTINLKDDFPPDTPYDIIDIDSVFDNTNDPNHYVDLLQSYDSVNKIITLSSAMDIGNRAWIRLIYRPVVAVRTGQDYYELKKHPSLTLSNINLLNKTIISKSDSVLNKNTNQAVIIPPPERNDIDISLYVNTNNARDQESLSEEVKRFFANNTSLTSWGTDEEYDLRVVENYDGQVGDNNDGVYVGKIRFMVIGALYFVRDAMDAFGVEQIKITGDVNITI